MKAYRILAVILLCLSLSCNKTENTTDRTADIQQIEQNIDNYDKAWDAKNVDGVLKGYAEEIDWTNAFGDRVQGKDELRELLETIFSLDFVMSGKNNYQTPDITFPSENIALARSTNIRTGQQWPDGRPMDDRIINHLRVYEQKNGNWLCIHHMISQAHNKMGK